MLIDVVRDGLMMVVNKKNRLRNYVMIDASGYVSIEYGAVRRADIFLSNNRQQHCNKHVVCRGGRYCATDVTMERNFTPFKFDF